MSVRESKLWHQQPENNQLFLPYEEAEEKLVARDYEESLLDMECNSDNKTDKCALLWVTVNDNNKDDDDNILDFIWEDIQ
jgi:hypothetical protein